MGKQALVIGGSVAGLASAVALARRGWTVTVIERDPPPGTDSGDEAFTSWDRRNVPQFRQPHIFSSRARNLLLEHIPEVVDRLHADGIEESNVFKLLAPPELWTADDDRYTGLMTRRPAFELALRLVAEGEPGVEIRCPAVVDGLVYATTDNAGPPAAVGLRLRDGTELTADLVLDCGGRRSPVAKWLASDRGIVVPEEIQTTSTTYYTRYYRQRPESMLNQIALFAVRGAVENLAFAGFTGDHGTFGVSYFVADHDDDLKVLRHNWAWEAAGRLFPMIEPWLDPVNSEPLHDVQVMAGNVNSRRRYVVDGEPLVLGVLSIGDSMCTTNPIYGWGASMALTYAFAAVGSIDEADGDLRSLALSYDARVAAEADGVFQESAAADRHRLYEWKGEEYPEWDREAMERQTLLNEGVVAGSLRDPVLGRAFLRRTNLIDPPAGTLDDPEVVARAENTRRILAGKPPRKVGPTRDELLAALADADPSKLAVAGSTSP